MMVKLIVLIMVIVMKMVIVMMTLVTLMLIDDCQSNGDGNNDEVGNGNCHDIDASDGD